MVLKSEQERVRTLLKDTITLLCKNGLSFSDQFSIEALIGITLDKDDVFLVSIKELIQSDKKVAAGEAESLSESEQSVASVSSTASSKRKRKKRKVKPEITGSQFSGSGSEFDDLDDSNFFTSQRPESKRLDVLQVKYEGDIGDDNESSDEVVFIKQEGTNDWCGNQTPTDTVLYPDFQTDMVDISGNNVVPGGGIETSAVWNQCSMPSSSTSMLNAGITPQMDTSGTSQEQDKRALKMMNFSGPVRHPIQGMLPFYGHKCRKYVCTVCNKAFLRKDHLEGHKAVHTGVRPYQCPFCDSSYGLKWNLKSHVEMKHAQQYQQQELNNPFNFSTLLGTRDKDPIE